LAYSLLLDFNNFDVSNGDADMIETPSLLPLPTNGLLRSKQTFAFTYLKSLVAEHLDESKHETA
jgi:hypothetical protein